MTIVRRLARPLLASAFVADGLDAVRHPGPRTDAARPLVGRVIDAVPLALPDDPEVYVRANGAVKAGAGALFALGRLPRLCAALMAASLVPTAYTQHAFWTEQDPQARRAQRQHFIKDVALVGATLIAAVDTQGKPGLSWRLKRKAHELAPG